jgi:hypothetical protein
MNAGGSVVVVVRCGLEELEPMSLTYRTIERSAGLVTKECIDLLTAHGLLRNTAWCATTAEKASELHSLLTVRTGRLKHVIAHPRRRQGLLRRCHADRRRYTVDSRDLPRCRRSRQSGNRLISRSFECRRVSLLLLLLELLKAGHHRIAQAHLYFLSVTATSS